MPLLTAQTLIHNRYQIVRLVGQGGMGAVYEAFDQRLRIPVALKQLLLNEPQIAAAFAREAHLLAGLRHSALPRMIDHFEYANEHFLVMEFIPGDDLATLLAQRGHAFPVQQVLNWGDQLLDVVEYLHQRQPPLLHRDIKPQNLKLSDSGALMLLDFGLAKGLQAASGVTTAPSLIAYTPQYAPLEQIQGASADPRSDLFAIGATLYHLMTGTPPIDALTRAAALIANQSDPLPASRTLNSQIPLHVDAALTQALALAPDHRPASAAAMRQALTLAITPATGATIVIKKPAESTAVTAQIPSTPSKQRKFLPIWLGLGILALVGALFAIPKSQPQPDEASRIATTVFAPTRVPTQTTSPSTAPSPTLPPVQAVKAGTAVPVSQTPIAPEQLAQVVELAQWGEGAVNSTYLSPDRQTLVYVGDLRVAVIALPSLELQTVIELPSPAMETSWIAPSPNIAINDQVIVLRLQDGTARIWRLADGEQIAQIGGPGDTIEEVTLSQDQRLLATLHRNIGAYSLKWWHVDDAQLQQQIDLPRQVSYFGMRFQEQDQRIAIEGRSHEREGSPSVGTLTIHPASGTLELPVYEALPADMRSFAIHPQLPLAVYILKNGQAAVQTPQSALKLWQIAETTPSTMVLHPTLPIMAITTADREALIWHLEQQTLLAREENSWSITMHPTAPIAAFRKGVDTIIWDLADKESILEIPEALQITFSLARDTFATRTYSDVDIWSLRDKQPLEMIPNAIPGEFFFSDENNLILANNNTIEAYNSQDGRSHAIQHLSVFSPPFTDTIVSSDNTMIAIVRDSQDIDVYDIASGKVIHSLSVLAANSTIHFSSDNRSLWVSAERQIVQWDLATATTVSAVQASKIVRNIAVTPDGQTILAAFTDGSIELLNAENGVVQRSIAAHDGLISKLLVTPDGRLMISASNDGSAKIWQLSDGVLLHTLQHTAAINDAVLLANGRQLATASDDETVGVWNIEDGSRAMSLSINSKVWRLAVNPAQQLLALSSYNATIALWSLNDQQELTRLTNHRGLLRRLAFTPDSRLLISASDDGTLRLWGIPTR